MSELMSLQDLANGHLDIQALGEAANGDENTIVTTRTGNTYPSAERAINIMFKNGGLPATPFKNKDEMTASSLPPGSYAIVTFDVNIENNVLWYLSGNGWVVSKYAPMMQPRLLSDGEDLNDLKSGFYTIYTNYATILNMPNTGFPTNVGWVFCIRYRGIFYQKFHMYNKNLAFERTGNGGDPNLTFNDWVQVVSMSDVDAKLSKKVSLNLFPNTDLTEKDSTVYQGTTSNGVLTFASGGVLAAFYEKVIDNKYLNIGDAIEFNVLVNSSVSDKLNADISVEFYNSSGSKIGSTVTKEIAAVTGWQSVSLAATIPALTSKIRLRFIGRGLGQSQFKVPVLASSSLNTSYIAPQKAGGGAAVTVGKTGADFTTIQGAIESLSNGGSVLVLDDGEYRESITINTDAHISIKAVAGSNVNIFGSDRLVLSKTSGMSKVYQAPLASKPTGMGGGRGEALIAEWGTASKPIPANEIHPLHRGLTHRLPYTEMFEAASKAELDTPTGNGKWFYESGTIYLSATDGSDASAKRYEARLRPVITQNRGTLELVRVNSWFSNADGMTFNGLGVTRTACNVYGAKNNGFADNANTVKSYRDISCGNGNDGINSTVLVADLTKPEINTRINTVYFDPYASDNGDDGISSHYRSDCTIYGGLFEHNTKADVVHVTGSNSTCYNTETRGTLNGFYTATDSVSDAVRGQTVMRCVGTKSTDNYFSYRTADNAELYLDNCLALEPTGFGFYQSGTNTGKIYAQDCRYSGDPAKAKSGNVVINNSDLLTP